MKRLLTTVLVALFATVLFGQTKTEIKPGELPNCMTEWLKTNMKGYFFDKAFKVENKGVVYFLARAALSKAEPKPKDLQKAEPGQVTNKPQYQWVESDSNCKSVKKVSEPKPEPGPKPTPQPKPEPAPQPKK